MKTLQELQSRVKEIEELTIIILRETGGIKSITWEIKDLQYHIFHDYLQLEKKAGREFNLGDRMASHVYPFDECQICLITIPVKIKHTYSVENIEE